MEEPQKPEDIDTEFPSWHAFRGVNDLMYARLVNSTPPILVRGEDLMDLRDQVIAKMSELEERLPWRRPCGGAWQPPSVRRC